MDFHFPQVHEAVAAAIPDREAFIWRDRRFTYAELAERTRRLASYLSTRGLGVSLERSQLAGHKSGQSHLAIYLYNCNEYLEGMLGAFKARVAPLNVNYRYVEEELLYLFENSHSQALLYQAAFAPRVAAIRDRLPELEVLIQVADESGNELLPGAIDYEDALARSSPELPDLAHSPDDLYILYTGGTTGMPKGVLWRSGDVFPAAMGGRKMDGSEYASVEEIAAAATATGGALRTLIGPPLMHGAAQWIAFTMMSLGATLILPEEVERLDPHDFLSTVEREKAATLSIVGDAFARPLLDQLAKQSYDLSHLRLIGSGGAPLSTANKRAFLEHAPGATVMDMIGSSETGAQGSNPATAGGEVTTGDFKPSPGAGVVSEDMRLVLQPGDAEMGWFAQQGRVPLGYLGDAEKTARTFPVIEGVRYSVPGDRAHYRENGSIEVLGRDSVTINSGGEKIFAEEVENALKQHPAVYDTVVSGRPSERWGEEVVAIVQLREGSTVHEEELLGEARQHISSFKLPKTFVFSDHIERSPSGKPDYRWAKERALEAG